MNESKERIINQRNTAQSGSSSKQERDQTGNGNELAIISKKITKITKGKGVLNEF